MEIKATIQVYGKRVLVTAIIVLIYFSVWRDIRGMIMENVIIPQVDYAIAHCDDTIRYHQNRSTSVHIFILDTGKEKYNDYSFVSPTGFFFLAGLVFIVLMGGGGFYYMLLCGYHLLIWIFSAALFLPALCNFRFILYLIIGAGEYFTPFVTMFIALILVSPSFRKKFSNGSGLHDGED